MKIINSNYLHAVEQDVARPAHIFNILVIITVTKNYVTDYLSLANRDIMVENEGQYVQRYVYGVDGARLSVQVTYADGTQRGQSGENLASDFAANDVEKVWYRHSLLDSTLLAVDENGEQIVHMSYDAWGVPQTETKLDANFAGLDNLNNFTGYTYDEVLELYFAQNRFYDAGTHRFTQQDPVKDGANWYVYCASSPTTSTDVFGLASSVRYIKGNNVRLRQSPSIASAILSTLNQDTPVTYLDAKTKAEGYNWAKVSAIGKTGWIVDMFLSLSPSAPPPQISAAWPSTDSEKLGVALAQYLLDSEVILGAAVTGTFFTNDGNMYSTNSELRSFTFAGEYYDRLQCAIRDSKMKDVVVFGVRIVDAGYAGYQDAVQTMPPHPFSIVGGTIIMGIDHLVFDPAPSVSGALEHALKDAFEEPIKKASQRFDAINNSILKYVIYKGDWSPASYEVLTNGVLNGINNSINTLNSYDLEVSPYDEAVVRQSAVRYLKMVKDLQTNYSSALEKEKAVLNGR